MTAKIASAFILLFVGASLASAQQPAAVNDRVASGMPTQYKAADCKIKPNHFKVSSAAGYLKSAIETDVPESRTRILGQGEKVVLEAIKQNGQDKNPAAWYYLGRIYCRRAGSLRPTRRSPERSSSRPTARRTSRFIDRRPGTPSSRRAAPSRRNRIPTPRWRCTVRPSRSTGARRFRFTRWQRS